jgi:hypothetical protein
VHEIPDNQVGLHYSEDDEYPVAEHPHFHIGHGKIEDDVQNGNKTKPEKYFPYLLGAVTFAMV